MRTPGSFHDLPDLGLPRTCNSDSALRFLLFVLGSLGLEASSISIDSVLGSFVCVGLAGVVAVAVVVVVVMCLGVVVVVGFLGAVAEDDAVVVVVVVGFLGVVVGFLGVVASEDDAVVVVVVVGFLGVVVSDEAGELVLPFGASDDAEPPAFFLGLSFNEEGGREDMR